jgi:hypothetical protein
MSSDRIQCLHATLDPRHADPLQPNSPSCGTQPAHISLTARRQRHARPDPSRRVTKRRRPKTSGRRLTLPLDRKSLHIRGVLTSQPQDSRHGVKVLAGSKVDFGLRPQDEIDAG